MVKSVGFWNGRRNKFICFSIVMFFAVSIKVNAQRNFVNGFIVNNANDTIYGKIADFGSPKKKSRHCFFKDVRLNRVTDYNPTEIKSFTCNNRKFVSIETDSISHEIKFTEVLIDGKVSLYNDISDNEVAFYIQKSDSSIIPLRNIRKNIIPAANDYYVMANRSSNSYVWDNEYKRTLHQFFFDSKKTLAKLNKLNYDQKELMDIVKFYTSDTQQDIEPLRFEAGRHQSAAKYGVFTGADINIIEASPDLLYPDAQNSKLGSDVSFSIPIGGFVNIPLSFINERLSFQVEVVYKHLNYNENSTPGMNIKIKSQTIELPFAVKYQLGKQKNSPFMAIGRETVVMAKSSVSFGNFTALKISNNDKPRYFVELGFDCTSNRIPFSVSLKYGTTRNMTVLYDSPGLSTSVGFVKLKSNSPEILFRLNF